MGQTAASVSSLFELQRNSLETTRNSMKYGLSVQQELLRTMTDFGPAREANQHSYDAMRAALDAYFDTVTAVTPGASPAISEYQDTVNAQLDALESGQIEALNVIEDNVKGGSASVTDWLDEFENSFDEQLDTVFDVHGDIEALTVDSVAGWESALALVQEQVTEAQRHIDAQAELIDESLEVLDGLGPKYSARLQEHGFESLETIAESTATAIAEAAEVTESQAEEWIESARSRR